MNKKIFYALLSATFYCCSLPLVRMYYSGEAYYLFLWWNLLLAWVPLIFSERIVTLIRKNKTISSSSLILHLIVWLLFFPNALYIFTDLIHLPTKANPNIPLWFDVIMVFSFASLGMTLGFISISSIQKEIKNTKLAFWLSNIVLVLSSFGIYLGRFPRLNSWDILTNPLELFIIIYQSLISPKAILFTVLVSFLLITSYAVFNSLIQQTQQKE